MTDETGSIKRVTAAAGTIDPVMATVGVSRGSRVQLSWAVEMLPFEGRYPETFSTPRPRTRLSALLVVVFSPATSKLVVTWSTPLEYSSFGSSPRPIIVASSVAHIAATFLFILL